MIKKKIALIVIILLIQSCAFKPLYQQSNFYHPYKIHIVVKSKDRYENNVSLIKDTLNQRINKKNSKNSNLRLVVSLNRNVFGMGINKDLSSDARMIKIELNYKFSDKKGKLIDGNISGSASFNYTTNNYANIVSVEDTSEKLLKSLSNDIADIILTKSFKRKVRP